MEFCFQPIGVVRSAFKEKFAIPRQPGLVDIQAVVELLPPYNVPAVVRGLEGFSHIWLNFVLHGVKRGDWHPTVRPPRLGGNQRVGVFASRATHRPNPLGLSVVELLRIDTDGSTVHLVIRGADLLDGTPILDIKPYIPYVDSIPTASGGYAAEAPRPTLNVYFKEQPRHFIEQAATAYPELEQQIRQLLALDPRPAFHADSHERIYGMALYDLNVRFTVKQDVAEVVAIEQQ